jgi:arylsulfatase A-like enzyme
MRLICCLSALVACAAEPPPCVTPSTAGDLRAQNVVVVLVDDLGVDKVGAYGLHPRPAPAPALDALAAESVMFRGAYAEPVCSAARASLLTGLRPTRTGVGGTVSPRDRRGELSESQVTLPAVLQDAGWHTKAVGKWHLSLFDADAATAPHRHGFDHFDGLIGNPTSSLELKGPRGYSRWEHIVDGDISASEQHLVVAQGDAAVDSIRTLPEPFFLYVAFSAPHEPYEAPPEHLYETADPSSLPGIGDALIEVMDTQLQRIVEALGDRGVLVVLSDNGTQHELMRPPSDPTRSKSSVYAGGARVPWLVRGPGLAPSVVDGLVHVTDLFPTVLGFAGLGDDALPAHLDGTSFAPALVGEPSARRCLFVENFEENGLPVEGDVDVSVVGERFTLVAHPGQPDELYRRDPGALDDGEELLGDALSAEARDARRELRRQLRAGR